MISQESIDEIILKAKSLIEKISQLLKTQKPPIQKPMQTNLDKIYQYAKSHLNTDASPTNQAPDSLACAETVWNVVYGATGLKISGSLIVSTNTLYKALLASPSFESVTEEEALPGSIVISPTGYSSQGIEAHGHTGIVAQFGILSNNSEDGKLEENYTKDTWRYYFGKLRGFPVCFFSMKN